MSEFLFYNCTTHNINTLILPQFPVSTIFLRISLKSFRSYLCKLDKGEGGGWGGGGGGLKNKSKYRHIESFTSYIAIRCIVERY
jgi:hypothetical protein